MHCIAAVFLEKLSRSTKLMVTCYLSPGAKVAHRASTYALQWFLSCVSTSLQNCHPALDLSFPSVRRQIVFWLASLSIFLRGPCQGCTTVVAGFCPMNRHFLLLTSSLKLSTLALSNISLLLTIPCHLIFIILLTHRFWNTSIFLASPSIINRAGAVAVHVLPLIYSVLSCWKSGPKLPARLTLAGLRVKPRLMFICEKHKIYPVLFKRLIRSELTTNAKDTT